MSSPGASHVRSGSSSSLLTSRHLRPIVLGHAFNQDSSCFSVALETGYRVYSTDPLREVLRKDSEEGGFVEVEMLYRSNLLALVGGGRSPRHPPSKVILFDEKTSCIQCELEFRSRVRRVLLRKDRIIVVLLGKIHVYSMDKVPILLQTFDTYDNPKGLCAQSVSEGRHSPPTIAFPALQIGHVHVTTLAAPASGTSANAAIIIPAHEGPLAALAINPSGSLLATASEKGTLIRVFEIKSGHLLHEFRRGADKAEIYSISFNSPCTKICVASDKGTIHIFNLEASSQGPTPSSSISATAPPIDYEASPASFDSSFQSPSQPNKQSSLSFMKELLPKYFSSHWSFAQCRVSEDPCVASFGPDPTTVLVVSSRGYFSRFRLDAVKGGECVREYHVNYLQLASSSD